MSHTSEIMQEALSGKLSTFREVQLLCGFTDEKAADYCVVSLKTLRRWRENLSPPLSALRLLAVRAGAAPWPDWQGWEVHSGYLFPPGQNRCGFGPGQVLVVTYLHAQVAEQKRQIEDLRARLDQAVIEGTDKARAA